MSDVGQSETSPGHELWCEANYTTTTAPYLPKPCNCGAPVGQLADWLEPFCAGFNAARGGLTDEDGEAFLRAAVEAYERSGPQRARRFLATGDPSEIPPLAREGEHTPRGRA